MRSIVLFAEDYGHEAFITALIVRMAEENGVQVSLVSRSVTGGHGRLISEFQIFLSGLQSGREAVTDLIVVGTDVNCKGYGERKREVDEVNEAFRDLTICAIPDPHIERWLLLDSAAFKKIFGKGCNAPDRKCERDRYKKLLAEAIHATGIVPPLGGMEYAEDLVKVMDLEQLEKANTSTLAVCSPICEISPGKRFSCFFVPTRRHVGLNDNALTQRLNYVCISQTPFRRSHG